MINLRSTYDIPPGYILGLVRDPIETNRHVAHLYKGTFDDPGNPMCRYGWNRKEWGYSIWRNYVSVGGVCKICLRRAQQGKEPIEYPYDGELEDENSICSD